MNSVHRSTSLLRRWGAAVLLLVLTCLAYAPSVRNGFIWDDDSYVTEQVTLRSLHGLWRIWIEAQAIPQYYPVTFTSLWIDYQLWGLNPLGYHVENVLLHVLNAILLWRILLFLGIPAAWWAAAVFALHPVHVESVEWITERKNTLSGAFYLAALLVYLRFLFVPAGSLKRSAWYALALVLFVCALFSKTVAATLPAVFLLVAWWRKERVGWRDIAAVVPFFVLGAVLAWVTTLMETFHVGAMGPDFQQSLLERCLVAGRVVCFYLGKLAWPHPLIFSYPRWRIDAGVWWQYLFPCAAVALAAALWLGRFRLGKGPLVALLFFVVSLVPVLGFLNVYPMRFSYVADHFQYLASIGPIVLATTTAAIVGRQRGSAAARWLRTAGAFYLAVLGALTWRQTLIYRDAKTVWHDTLARNPASWLAHNNLGVIAEREGKFDEAKAHFAATVAAFPGDAMTYYGTGNVLAGQGSHLQAVVYFEAAIRLDPSYAPAYNNLGNVLTMLGRSEEAIRRYREALRIEPNDAVAYGNLAGALASRGKIEEAIAACHDALRVDPTYAEAYYNLGLLRARQGRWDDAAAQYAEAIRVRPAYLEARFRLATLLAGAGKTREAEDQLREVVRLDPENLDARRELDRLAASSPR